MPYVSAEWTTDELTGKRTIRATDDEGTVWSIPEVMCDIPPWPEFLQSTAGKKFLAKEEKRVRSSGR